MSVGWGSPGDKPPIGELKRGDGLQNLLASLDFAKHEYWSQHGVNHNVFKADLNTARYSPPDSVANTSLTLAPPSLRSVSGHQEISPYICSSIVSVSQRPASCSEEAKMVEFSKMDNSALVAAALAGSSKSTNTGSKAKTNNDSDMISSSQHPVQTVSPCWSLVTSKLEDHV